MIPGFGKEQISLGSAPDNDVVLQGPGVAPRHARIVKQGAQLLFIDPYHTSCYTGHPAVSWSW